MSKWWTAGVYKQAVDIAKSQGIDSETLAFMLKEFFRLADIVNVEADETIDFVAQTNNEWLRQKPLKDGVSVAWRNFIHADRQNRILELIIILKKTDATYDVVERLWRQWKARRH